MVLSHPVRIGNKQYTEIDIKATWSGKYPNLCNGKWTLIINDQDFSYLLNGKGEMNTFGEYDSWHFENWDEVWETYEDGLNLYEWIEENKEWLTIISDDRDVHEAIYNEISSEDWRHNSCGGCI